MERTESDGMKWCGKNWDGYVEVEGTDELRRDEGTLRVERVTSSSVRPAAAALEESSQILQRNFERSDGYLGELGIFLSQTTGNESDYCIGYDIHLNSDVTPAEGILNCS